MSKFHESMMKFVSKNYGDDDSYDMDDIIIHNSDIVIDGNKMKYLLFEFETEITKGHYERVYKAIKMIKLVRIPKKELTLTHFLNMQQGIITGWNMSQLNYLQICANITKPYKKGLIFAYGVQGISTDSIEEAMQRADEQLAALEKGLTGTFRTMEYTDLDAEDARWIFRKMNEMKDMLVIRGVPEPKISQGRAKTNLFTSAEVKDAEEQSEEFLLGMDEYEYMLVITATTVSYDTLSRWTEAALKEQTYWASLKQGNKSMSFGVSIPMVYGSNLGASEGWNSGTSESFGQNYSESQSHSVGTSESWSEGTSTSVGTSTSESSGTSFGTSEGISNSSSSSLSNSISQSSSTSQSMSSSESFSDSTSWSTSTGHNTGYGGSQSTSTSHSDSTSSGTNESYGGGVSGGFGSILSFNGSSNTGTNSGIGTSDTSGTSSGTSWSEGTSNSQSTGGGSSHSTSVGTSSSISNGLSTSQGLSQSVSSGTSQGISQGLSSSSGTGTSNSYGTSTGHSIGTNESTSTSTSQGSSTSQGTSSGISGGTSSGVSGSLGLGPSISFSKTFAWEDREATRLVDMLQYSLQRFISATNNMGMWFTDVYIVTENSQASSAATTLAMSSWHSPNTMISPLQVYKPSPMEREYLLKHLSVFSPSTKKEGIPGQFESYKYSTLLLSNELAALSHPPRVNVGGIQASVDDPMVLTIPANRQNGDIFLGYVADVEKYSRVHGFKSGFKYTLKESELHHAYFSGASRSGKTVAAKRAVTETYNNVRRGEQKKKMRFVIMDPKRDWRALAKVIPPENFRFYSLADPTFHPIKMNLMKIPKGVYAERYVNTLKEIFVRSFGLGDRGFNILGQAMIDVYNSVGVFEENVRLNMKDKNTGLYPATERSKLVTLEDVAKRLHEIQEGGGVRGEKQDAIQRILDRMYDFESDASITKEIFCNRGDEGMGIDDLLGKDDVIVLESFGMNMMVSSFIFGLLTSSIYQYSVANGGFISKDEYETILVLEEANQILIGEDRDNLGGPNPFEIILDQSAGFGLFIWSITQKIADMPQSILANCAIKVIGRQDRPDDIELSVVQIGKEGKIQDRQWKQWFPDMPQGWFIVKSTRNRDFKMNAPVHVLVEYLDAEPPTNEELDSILKMNELVRKG